jgi:hypothetical protein
MDTSISSSPILRPDVVSVETSARPTAPQVPFSDVLAGGARALMSSAQSVVQSLPGSPLMALAIRPGATALLSSASSTTPEGPGGASTSTLVGTSSGALGSTSGVAAGSTSGTGDDGISQTLSQDQQMNLYYLQVQEEVNAQNRTYSALSNVIEVEHNTAKTAIGNIH